MQGTLDKQTSGNDWSQSPGLMLHEGQQPWRIPGRAAGHGLLFAGDEAQLAGFESQMAQFDKMQAEALDKIRHFYLFTNEAEVNEFLQSHKLVTQVLGEAIDHLKKHFEGSAFSLRLKTDEYDDPTLYAAASWNKEPRHVIIALNGFNREWWLANSYPAGRHLSFTYDLA